MVLKILTRIGILLVVVYGGVHFCLVLSRYVLVAFRILLEGVSWWSFLVVQWFLSAL